MFLVYLHFFFLCKSIIHFGKVYSYKQVTYIRGILHVDNIEKLGTHCKCITWTIQQQQHCNRKQIKRLSKELCHDDITDQLL